MDDLIPSSTPPVQAAPVQQPVAPAAPVQAVAAPVQEMPATPTSSGDSGGGFMEAIKSINIVETGLLLLGAVAMYYSIYYFKYQIQNNKKIDTMQKALDDMTIKIADVSGKVELMEAGTQQQADGFF